MDKLWWGGSPPKGTGSVCEGWSGEAVSPVPKQEAPGDVKSLQSVQAEAFAVKEEAFISKPASSNVAVNFQ